MRASAIQSQNGLTRHSFLSRARGDNLIALPSFNIRRENRTKGGPTPPVSAAPAGPGTPGGQSVNLAKDSQSLITKDGGSTVCVESEATFFGLNTPANKSKMF